MRWHKLIRLEKDGVSFAADVNAVIAINQGGTDASSKVEAVSHVRVVQDPRRHAPNSSGVQPPDHEQEVPHD